jgi:urea carboxylase
VTTATASRYSWGGDEHLVVQMSEAMSLEANLQAMAITKLLAARELPGIIDICPSNASFLVRFDPDVLPPAELKATVEACEEEIGDSHSLELDTRIIEVPVWYDDPYTSETLHRFRDRHQRPEGNDLDFAAIENGLPDAQAVIEAHHSSPWITSMVGFVAGLPFMFQMVPESRQLEVPKYVRPRTDTPALTVGHGGCFAVVYSVRGAGGYQMFGITPIPIFDPAQRLADFSDFMVFFKPGDIVKFRPIDGEEYEKLKAEVEAGTYRYKQAKVRFNLTESLADQDAYNATLLEALNGQ